MISLDKQINLSAIAIVLTAAIALTACTEKAENSNRAETVASPLPENKVTQLQREAGEGDPDAQYELAYLYENGLGVPKDEAKALELYQQAADQGHPAAQDNIDAMNKSK